MDIFASLHKSKVNLPIKTNHFVQGTPISGLTHTFPNINEMLDKHHNEMNDFSKDNDYLTPKVSPGNTFLMLCLHIIDGKTSLLRVPDAIKNLTSFKADLANNLDNDKQLYKKFGFSRKRNLNVDKMKAELILDDTDAIIGPEHTLYLAKLIGAHIVAIDPSKLERHDLNADASPSYLFTKNENVFSLYSGTLAFPEKIEADIKGTTIWNQLSSKATGLKKLNKFMGQV